MTEAAVLSERHDRVLLITINRPEARNSVNADVAQTMVGILDQLDADPGLSVGVLTGAGKGFSAGMDLKAFVSGGMPTVEGRGFAGLTEKGSDKPLIAAVEGFALAGGLEIALACDLIIGASNAKFGIPEVGVGLFAGAGALLQLPRRVSYGTAMELALTADPVTGERAHEIGLIDRVVEPGQAVSAAMELAERIARNAPLALSASKQILRNGIGLTEPEFWKFQTDFNRVVFGSSDAIEGATAFAEKRPPQWTGE